MCACMCTCVCVSFVSEQQVGELVSLKCKGNEDFYVSLSIQLSLICIQLSLRMCERLSPWTTKSMVVKLQWHCIRM